MPGAERVRIDLVDHYAGERISTAIQAGLSFQEAFPDQAEGELHELRRKFRLQGVRRAPGAGAAGRPASRRRRRRGRPAPGRRVAARGRRRRRVARVPAPPPRPRHGRGPDELVFTDAQGAPLDGRRARHDYLRLARSVRISLQSNTEFCTGLLAARYDGEAGVEGWQRTGGGGMKAALLPAYDAELVDRERRRRPRSRAPSDVIVKVGGAGLCRTDLHIIEGIWKEKVDVELPYILGHENAGWVEAVGDGRDDGQAGRRGDRAPGDHLRALPGLPGRRGHALRQPGLPGHHRRTAGSRSTCTPASGRSSSCPRASSPRRSRPTRTPASRPTGRRSGRPSGSRRAPAAR